MINLWLEEMRQYGRFILVFKTNLTTVIDKPKTSDDRACKTCSGIQKLSGKQN